MITFKTLILSGQVSTPNVLNAIRIAHAPRLDGILEEPCRQRAHNRKSRTDKYRRALHSNGGQGNNEDKKILFNFRVNRIPVIGSDFYLAVNQLYDTADGGFKLKNTTILSKLIWRFVM